jgi:hypothetical protein
VKASNAKRSPPDGCDFVVTLPPLTATELVQAVSAPEPRCLVVIRDRLLISSQHTARVRASDPILEQAKQGPYLDCGPPEHVTAPSRAA